MLDELVWLFRLQFFFFDVHDVLNHLYERYVLRKVVVLDSLKGLLILLCIRCMLFFLPANELIFDLLHLISGQRIKVTE